MIRCWRPIERLLLRLLLFTFFLPYLSSANSTVHGNQIQPCRFRDSIHIPAGVKPISNSGQLTYNGTSYEVNEYAIIGQQIAPEYRVCKSHTYVRLCCPLGEQMDELKRCLPADLPDLELSVYDSQKKYSFTVNLTDFFAYKTGKLTRLLDLDPDDEWILFENGSLLVSVSEEEPVLWDNDRYCLTYNYESMAIAAYVSGSTAIEGNIFQYAMLSTVPFLLATFTIYAILPELRNTHGKSLMCFLLALAANYSLMSYNELTPPMKDLHICKIIGYNLYLTMLIVLLWLNVISFDLWWNFSGVKSNSKKANNKKFWWYCLYAFGVPALIVIVCVAIDHSSLPEEYLPQIGINTCFIVNEFWIRTVYLSIPIFLTATSNGMFFILTALKIRKVQRDIAIVSQSVNSHRERRHFHRVKYNHGLFVRLFIIMGVPWFIVGISETFWDWDIIEIIRWVNLADLLFILQVQMIFHMFVMKPKIKTLLVKRWNVWRNKGQRRIVRGSSRERSAHLPATTTTNFES